MSEPTERRPARRKAFWSTLPGMLTAVAAVITAIATLLTALVAARVIGPGKATAVPPPAGGALFEDTFDDPAGGWDIYADADVETGYVNGEYRVAARSAGMTAWGSPSGGGDWAAMAAQVDARQVEGPLDAGYGLLARIRPDGQSFYRFSISAEGYYYVELATLDQWTTLADWQPSPAIRQGLGQVNSLRVECDRSKLSFYANGVLLAETIDNTLASGNVGLSVSAYDEGGAVVHFDNLRVSGLGEP